jgi:hypothetical protein
MPASNLFEEMLAAYPAERRELARKAYHRFADGDDTQFFTQLFLLLEVYGHYVERIPTRMIAANVDSLATLQEVRVEVGLLAKSIESREVNITSQASRMDELCRLNLAKCNETIVAIESTVKNLGAKVDTQVIVKGISATLESGIRREVITPFLNNTEELARKVMPTLEKIRASAAEAESEWSRRIWRTAWTTCLLWSITVAIIITGLICWVFINSSENEMAGQLAAMTRVVKYNQEAFQKLAIAQIPIQVLPTQSEGPDHPSGYALTMDGAYAAEMQQKAGCIFFKTSVEEEQLWLLQRAIQLVAQMTNNPAK